MNDHSKVMADAAAIIAAIGSWLEYLPTIAAAASLIWTLIRIYETKTVQGLLGRNVAAGDNLQ